MINENCKEKEKEKEWVMLKNHMLNNHIYNNHTEENLNFRKLNQYLINHFYSNEEMNFFIETYHNNYDYVQTNISITDKESFFQEFCFVIAISFSHDLEMIKYLMNKFKIYKNIGYLKWHRFMSYGFIFNPNLLISEYIMGELKFDKKYRDNSYNYFNLICLKNPNIEVFKFLATQIHEDVMIHLPNFEYVCSNNDSLNNNIIIHIAHSNNSEIIKYERNLEIIKYLFEFTNILSKIELKNIFRWGLFNFVLCEKYILFIKNYTILQNFIKEMYNIYKESHFIDPVHRIIKLVHQNNSLMLSDEICNYSNLKSPFEEDFQTFVNLVNKLTIKVPLREKKIFIESMDEQKAKRMRFDFSEQIALFIHNGYYYKGQQSVIDSMIMLKNISDCCDIKDVELSINVPKYIINLYVLSVYTGIFYINDIEVTDLIDFLKFIEAYETVSLSLKVLEKDLIDYFEKNKICINDYLTNMCIRHRLKNMYLYFKLKLII